MRRFGILLMILLLAAASPTRADRPLRLRLGWAAIPGQLSAVIYQKPELLAHYGKSYVVESLHMPGSGPQITAVATGDLEIAQFAPAAFALAVQNGGLADLRVIGDATRDGFDGYYSRRYSVRADSKVARIEDLKGKVVATNSISGAMDMAFRSMARRHGMEDKRDYSVVEIDFANMVPALLAGRVDLASLTTPFSIEPEKMHQVRTLFTIKDVMGESEITIMAARANFIAAHRPQLVDFFEDSQRAMRWFYDPENRAEALTIMARISKQPVSAFAGWVFTKNDDYRDLDLRPNLDAMQRNIDMQRELGLLKIDLEVRNYADLSLLEEAAKRPR
jgi:sulfonate transport system substrate-binding protein